VLIAAFPRRLLVAMSQRGFTLIELMVGLAITVILILLSLPSMTSYYQNSKISNATQNYAAGLQLARAEAIRRNLPVDFMLTDAAIGAGNNANVATAVNGRNWVVRFQDPASAPGIFTQIEAKSAIEGANQAAGSVPSVNVVSANTVGGVVTFNGFGGTTTAVPVTLDITNPTGGACAEVLGPMRCLRVLAEPGGRVRVCDPAISTLGDSRTC
jgi:type IV fimbrial biogenesis protein FimT